MPRIKGTSHAQTIFLRAFLKNPAGPPPAEWPPPAILRRWLRRPTFRAALQSVRDAARFQTDFHLAAAGTSAAASLQTLAATPGVSADALPQVHALLHLLRHAHVRQRFNPDEPQAPQLVPKAIAPLPQDNPTYEDLFAFLRDCPREIRVTGALYEWENHLKKKSPNARPSAA